MYTEEDLRKEAVQRFLSNEKPTDICRDLNRSRRWFYKWLNRYKTGKPDWYKDESTAPKTIPHKTDAETEKRNKRELSYARVSGEVERIISSPPPPSRAPSFLQRERKEAKETGPQNTLTMTPVLILFYSKLNDLIIGVLFVIVPSYTHFVTDVLLSRSIRKSVTDVLLFNT